LSTNKLRRIAAGPKFESGELLGADTGNYLGNIVRIRLLNYSF
jgi:hypothetical protein